MASRSSTFARTFVILHTAPTKVAFAALARSISYTFAASSHNDLAEVGEVEVAEHNVQVKDDGKNLLCPRGKSRGSGAISSLFDLSRGRP